MATATLKKLADSRPSYTAVRWIPALILIAAAAAKAYALSTSLLIVSDSWVGSRLPQAIIVFFEIVMAALICGHVSKASRWLSITVFSAFTLYHLVEIHAGACRCLGHLAVPHWAMLLITTTTAGVLILSRPPSATTTLSFASRSLVVLAAAGIALASTQAILANVNSAYRLRVDDWKGKRFPLDEYLGVDRNIYAGETIILFHKSTCQRCRSLGKKALQLAEDVPADTNLVWVQLPPRDRIIPPPEHEQIVSGQLAGGISWLVETPLLVRLRDGVVMNTGHSPDSILQLRSLEEK